MGNLTPGTLNLKTSQLGLLLVRHWNGPIFQKVDHFVQFTNGRAKMATICVPPFETRAKLFPVSKHQTILSRIQTPFKI